jgi:chorismate dehydratase
MSNTKKGKLGAVSYLNTVPLIACFEDLSEHYSLHLDVPSRLADAMARGELECALIPTIEVINSPEYQVVSDACIGCCGPVWSVKILSRKPISTIESIALDEGSRTSIALSKILMAQHWKVSPACRQLGLSEDYRQVETDAVLIIGDRAMQDDPSFPYRYDLGEVWNEWTGLPFVFAVWAGTPDANLAFLERELAIARDKGLHQIESIIAKYHHKHGLDVARCRAYFIEHLNFYLGEEERESMVRFATLANELGLTKTKPNLRFYDCQIA